MTYNPKNNCLDVSNQLEEFHYDGCQLFTWDEDEYLPLYLQHGAELFRAASFLSSLLNSLCRSKHPHHSQWDLWWLEWSCSLQTCCTSHVHHEQRSPSGRLGSRPAPRCTRPWPRCVFQQSRADPPTSLSRHRCCSLVPRDLHQLNIFLIGLWLNIMCNT